jgi:hypothetical protein
MIRRWVVLGLALLVELHSPTGQVLYVNGAEISNLRVPPSGSRSYFTQGVHCVIVMTNGRALGVAEDCATVARKLEQK